MRRTVRQRIPPRLRSSIPKLEASLVPLSGHVDSTAAVLAGSRNRAECMPVLPGFRAVGAGVVKSTLRREETMQPRRCAGRHASGARELLDALGQRVRARRRQPGRSLRSAAPVAEAYGVEAPLELARQEANRLRTERLEAGALE